MMFLKQSLVAFCLLRAVGAASVAGKTAATSATTTTNARLRGLQDTDATMYPLGTPVYWKFEDGWYKGEITDFNQMTGSYTVSWEDETKNDYGPEQWSDVTQMVEDYRQEFGSIELGTSVIGQFDDVPWQGEITEYNDGAWFFVVLFSPLATVLCIVYRAIFLSLLLSFAELLNVVHRRSVLISTRNLHRHLERRLVQPLQRHVRHQPNGCRVRPKPAATTINTARHARSLSVANGNRSLRRV